MSLSINSEPLISVIIPCYNHGSYLSKAIESVLSQSYQNFEIIIIDDGSTDNSKEIAKSYQQVNYFFQKNAGLSAARNKGIKKSHGQLAVFLDADDWLLPDAFSINLKYIIQNPDVAFVSGAYEIIIEPENTVWPIQKEVLSNHYCHLLEVNYIGMHAAVMFQRWVFDLFKYDTSLKSCEDYDLYLKITRRFGIISHTEFIAAYRFHDNNMSGNHRVMLKSALCVLQRQEKDLKNETERRWYEKGLAFWTSFYSEKIYKKLQLLLFYGNQLDPNDLNTLKQTNIALYETFIKSWNLKEQSLLFAKLRQILQDGFSKMTGRNRAQIPENINITDLGSTLLTTLGPVYKKTDLVDQYHIENFFQKNAATIQGRVLEVGNNDYTLRYGGDHVTQSDIIDMDKKNPKATFSTSLAEATYIPDHSFDCILLTQPLYLTYHCKAAIKACYRILKPNGTLLLTVRGINYVAQDKWGKYWLWPFTAQSISQVLSEYFKPEQVQIETIGNVLVAKASLDSTTYSELTNQPFNLQHSQP